MSNISFDNPWLLFIALPLIAVILVPFFITVRKDNANFHNIASVSLHAIICICITLVISGMTFQTVITETQVFVLADVSYSTEGNLEEVQASVEKVARKLPKNSKMGVICFGRDYKLVSGLGEAVPDVTEADIDGSATDIGSALRFAGSLFDDGVIKRIIIITDGVETVTSNNIVKVVGALQADDIYIDAVFIDDNIPEETKEIQIDSVEATSATYCDRNEEVSVMIRANCGFDENGERRNRTDAYLYLYRNGVPVVERKPVALYDGLNVETITLPTDEAGTFNYEVRVAPVSAENDTSTYNNSYYFSQSVSNERNVLFLGGTEADIVAGRKIYGDTGVTYIRNVTDVPFTVEDMYVYDEIVLSNFDVRTIRASAAFMTSLTSLVNEYGKTLTTFGNTFIQEASETDTVLQQLSDLLPVRIGNYDQDSRLYAIVLDISLSMNFSSRLAVAKRAAIELINMLNADDTVMVLGYSQVIDDFLLPTKLTVKSTVIEKINEKEVENGTSLSGALEHTYSKMQDYKRFQQKNVIVITDAISGKLENRANAGTVVVDMCKQNITFSALGIYPSEEDSKFLDGLVFNGYETDTAFYQSINHESEIDVVLGEITEEAREVCIDELGVLYQVDLRRPDEEVAEGVNNVGYIDGFWYSKAKSQSTVVLTAKYFRDKITSFDVPVYAYWSGGGKGTVVSFLSDIASDWANGWVGGTDGGKFLSNIPEATLPKERVNSPFLVNLYKDGNTTAVNVLTSSSLADSTSFTVSLVDPNGLVTTTNLVYGSNAYIANFDTDAPGIYKLKIHYENKNAVYDIENDFSVSYYAEYDSFTTYSESSLYRLLSSNGSIIDLENIKSIENTDSEYTSFTMSFTLPLMVVCAVLFIADIVIRQLKWKDVTSFFSGLFRRRR